MGRQEKRKEGNLQDIQQSPQNQQYLWDRQELERVVQELEDNQHTEPF